MRNKLIAAFFTAVLALGTAHARVRAHVYVGVAPPPPIVEQPGFAPHPGWVWRPGYYRWDGDHYVWVPGYWVLPPSPGALWVSGHWVHRHRGWFFVEGHWRF
jgi:hypothetical protein